MIGNPILTYNTKVPGFLDLLQPEELRLYKNGAGMLFWRYESYVYESAPYIWFFEQKSEYRGDHYGHFKVGTTLGYSWELWPCLPPFN